MGALHQAGAVLARASVSAICNSKEWGAALGVGAVLNSFHVQASPQIDAREDRPKVCLESGPKVCSQPDADVRRNSAMQGLLAVSNVPKAVGQFRGRVVTNDTLFAKKFGSVICNQTATRRRPVRRESGRSQQPA